MNLGSSTSNAQAHQLGQPTSHRNIMNITVATRLESTSLKIQVGVRNYIAASVNGNLYHHILQAQERRKMSMPLFRRVALSRGCIPMFNGSQVRFISDRTVRAHRKLPKPKSFGPGHNVGLSTTKLVADSTGRKAAKKEFNVQPLIVVSTLISMPIGYFVNEWMTNFAFRQKLKVSNPEVYDFFLRNVRINSTLKNRVLRKQLEELEARARAKGLIVDAEMMEVTTVKTSDTMNSAKKEFKHWLDGKSEAVKSSK
jgi:hypothetical protein